MENRTALKAIRLLFIGLGSAFLAIPLSGCTAAAFGKPSLAIEVQSAVSSGNVNVRLVNGTAVLTGRVASAYDSNAAVRAAARYEGVERVDNRIFVEW